MNDRDKESGGGCPAIAIIAGILLLFCTFMLGRLSIRPRVVEVEVERIVKLEMPERIIEVERLVEVEKIVEKPVAVERVVTVEKVVPVQVPMPLPVLMPVERIVYLDVEKVVYVEIVPCRRR